MSTEVLPPVRLSNGVMMPPIGLGTWPLDDDQARAAVASALGLGWRLIDTAENYGNERGVGQAIRESGIPRGEVFLTTKFNKAWHSLEGPRQACEASLERLGLDVIDLLLIHWPNPAQGRFVQAFEGMQRLLETGLVRSIGTSNFKVSHLQRLFDAGMVPHVNQIQLDPYHLRDDIVAVHRERGIVTEAWGPIGRTGPLQQDPVIGAIARRLGRSPAQVVLRWHVQSGVVPMPKSADPRRQAQNLAVFDFELTSDDMAALRGLDRPDPDMLDSDVYSH